MSIEKCFEVIDASSLNEQEKSDLKLIFLEAGNIYLRYLKDGEELPIRFELLLNNRIMRATTITKRLGIEIKAHERLEGPKRLPKHRDPRSALSRRLSPAYRWTDVTFPVALFLGEKTQLEETLSFENNHNEPCKRM